MSNAPPARLIDLTRLTSRLGRGPLTGVDRVERAYLDHLLAGKVPVFGLVRLALGYALLDRAGMGAFAGAVASGVLPEKPDLTGRITRRGQPIRARAETMVRALAVATCLPPLLPRSLRKHLPGGFHYLNTGHSNLSDRGMRRLKAGGAARTGVLIHDVIPLDHPEFTRAGIPAVFARKIAATARHADLVIHPTASARQRTEARFADAGRIPPGVTAHLGVPRPTPGDLPPGFDPALPYFVALGTIEPRKNHALLLDVWDDLPLPARLIIIGTPGWADPALFRRIAGHPRVTMLSGLPDAAVTAILSRATALLFPTRAEGFGLPPVEAALLGVPVICSDLPVLREVLTDYPVYLNPDDRYSWAEAIRTLGQAQADRPGGARQPFIAPDWASHFNTVLSLI